MDPWYFMWMLAFATAAVNAAPTDCPAFNDWHDWTDKCLWFPMEDMQQDVADACRMKFNVSDAGFADLMPAGFKVPERCGQCSFKLRCRTRERTEGCFSMEAEKQTCAEYNNVCELPKAPLVGCRWGLFADALKACAFAPDMPDWRRAAFRKFLEVMPEGNCVEKDNKCMCCCHPYQPNEEGTECVKVEETAQCTTFGPYNDWSKCTWFPMSNMIGNLKEHCGLDFRGDISSVVPTPAGFQIPDQCGFCSFRVRCRKRDRVDGCFHIDVDKKSCGEEDCKGCGEVCTIPYLNGTNCEWTQVMGEAIVKKVETMTSGTKLPYWRKRGIKDILKNMPYGKCKDINGECKCCCHPYEPNETGTACVLSSMCHMN